MLVYTVVVWLAKPLLVRKLQRRAVAEPLYGEHIQERFGYYSDTAVTAVGADWKRGDSGWVWVHSVSLGETRAAAAMVMALRQHLPGMRLLLTHSTATGRTEGEKLLQPGDRQVWLPWDTPAAVRRFLQHFCPRIGVLMETEVWPHLVATCRLRGIPLVLANARLNETSYQRAMQWAALSHPTYAGLYAVWAQTPADAQRLQHIGAPVRAVLGNVKFDVLPDARQLALGQAWRQSWARPIVVLASSREGEEALWLECVRPDLAVTDSKNSEKTEFSLVDKDFYAINNNDDGAPNTCHATPQKIPKKPGVQWLIVPRHPQRVDAVERLLMQAGLTVARRSAWSDAGPAAAQDADVWLGDSLGEMAMYYGMADIAVLGGSFAPLGGQNLIEAAACGCPVIAGPHTFNFAQATEQACHLGAAWQVADMDTAVQAVHAWLKSASDGAARRGLDAPSGSQLPYAQARAAALQFAHQHRGAAQAYAHAISAVLADAE